MSQFTSIDYLYALLFGIAVIGAIIAVLFRITGGKSRNMKEVANDLTEESLSERPGLVTKKASAQSETDRKYK